MLYRVPLERITMITLKYRLITSDEPFCALCEIIDGDTDTVRFEIPTDRFTEMEIAGIRVKARNGACEITFAELPEGRIDIFAIKGGKRISSTALIKAEGYIFRFPYNEIMFEQLICACSEITKKLKDCEKRLADAEAKIQPRPLLKFE